MGYMPPGIDDAPWSGDAFERLGQLETTRNYIEWEIDKAVVECRHNAQHVHSREKDELHDTIRDAVSYAPISWARIGSQLGITRQAAHRKYAHLEPDDFN